MTFEDYWQLLMKQRPIADDQKVLLTKEQFKYMLEQSWNLALESTNPSDDTSTEDVVDWLFHRDKKDKEKFKGE